MTEPIVWRPALWIRISAPACFVALFLWSLAPSGLGLAIGTSIAVLAGCYALLLRPLIRLDETTLTVVNPFGATRIELAQVADAAPGYSGITVTWHDQAQTRQTTAWAVQKANISGWTGAWARADQVSETIRQAATQAQARTPSE